MAQLYRPGKLFAYESIETQLDGFGERLELVITGLVDELNANSEASITEKHPSIKHLEMMIYERLKLKTTLITDEHLAAVLPFYSNKNHIFLPELIRGELTIRDQQKLLRTFDERKGSVNLKKAVLGGIFSEYEHPLYMNFNVLVREIGMTAKEITACMLHELGHAFNACYYTDRTDRTNQVLAAIARNLNDPSKGGDVEYIYKELSTITPSITKESVDTMVNGPKVVSGALWFKTIVGIVKSQMEDDTYNKTAFEERADNFAARFGYGKDIILALDKLYHGAPEKHLGSFLLIQILSAAGMIALLAVILVATSIAMGLSALFLMVIVLIACRDDVKDMTYDELKQRYLRLRMDVIDQLKSSHLNKAKVKERLESIYAMDLVIKDTRIVKGLPGLISNFIFSGGRNAKNAIEAQKMMEQLASNDLFIKSAEFKVMA